METLATDDEAGQRPGGSRSVRGQVLKESLQTRSVTSVPGAGTAGAVLGILHPLLCRRTQNSASALPTPQGYVGTNERL